MTARTRTFRKHRRPCGQPAAVGGMGCFRPLPPQTGHFVRTNATPSDFPFSSTGFATYPVPLQFGQSSESTLLPLSLQVLCASGLQNSQHIVFRYELRTRTCSTTVERPVATAIGKLWPYNGCELVFHAQTPARDGRAGNPAAAFAAVIESGRLAP